MILRFCHGFKDEYRNLIALFDKKHGPSFVLASAMTLTCNSLQLIRKISTENKKTIFG